MLYSLQIAMIRAKKGRSTHCVVGFDGKLRISTFGRGYISRMACSNSARKSEPGFIGMERMSAPAITGP